MFCHTLAEKLAYTFFLNYIDSTISEKHLTLRFFIFFSELSINYLTTTASSLLHIYLNRTLTHQSQ